MDVQIVAAVEPRIHLHGPCANADIISPAGSIASKVGSRRRHLSVKMRRVRSAPTNCLAVAVPTLRASPIHPLVRSPNSPDCRVRQAIERQIKQVLGPRRDAIQKQMGTPGSPGVIWLEMIHFAWRGRRRMRQAGLFGLSNQLKRLSDCGDPLETMSRLVDFAVFRPALEKALAYGDGAKGGRPP